jgi:tetratricopeptide (TPR) repeat protein
VSVPTLRHRRRPLARGGWLAAAWFACASAALSGQAPAPPAPPQPAVRLEAGVPVTRSIAGGQSHSYQIHIEAGQFVDLVVEQQGIDLEVVWTAPGGAKLADLDGANGIFGPELLCGLARETGDYRLDVAASEPKPPEAKYRVEVLGLRVPTDTDRARGGAMAKFIEAENLRGQGAADATTKAIVLYEEAARTFREAGDVNGELRAVFFMAYAKEALGLTPESLAAYEQALPLSKRAGDPGYEASALTWMGVAKHHLGDPTGAQELYDRAIAIEERVRDEELLAFTLHSNAQLYLFLGDHESATRCLARSGSIMHMLGDRRAEGITLNDEALILDEMGEADAALRKYEAALATYREIGDKNNEAISLNNMALVYGGQGNWQKALELHELALPLRRAVGTKYGEAYTLNNMGVAHGKLGQIEKAEAELAGALDLRRQIGDRFGEATTLQALGDLRLSSGQAASAVPDLDKALEIRRSFSDRNGEAETLASLARAARASGDLERARRRAAEAVAVVESRRHLIEASTRPAFLGAARRYYDLQIELLMAGRDPAETERSVRAFETSERARARSLIELLAESRARIRRGVDPELLSREQTVRRTLGSKLEGQTRMLARKHTDAEASEAAAQIEKLLEELQQLEARIRKASPRYAALTNPEPVSAATVRGLLDDDTVLLEFAMGEEASFLWLVEKGSITAFTLPAPSRIEAAARSVYDEWQHAPAAPGAAVESKAGVELGRMLFGPLGDRIAGKRLAVVPDGALAFLPWAALPEPGPSARPLAADHEIVVLPSASTLALLRSGERRPPSMTLAVVADPVFDRSDPRVKAPARAAASAAETTSSSRGSVERSLQDLGPGGLKLERLAFTRREATSILSLVPAGSGRAWLDFSASRGSALGEELARYRYVHFATHAFSNSLHPELSGLVLSLVDAGGADQEGFVPASEIFDLDLSADVVVLSACRTALGKEVRGEGVLGLTPRSSTRERRASCRASGGWTTPPPPSSCGSSTRGCSGPAGFLRRPPCGRRRTGSAPRSAGRLRTTGPASSSRGSGDDRAAPRLVAGAQVVRPADATPRPGPGSRRGEVRGDPESARPHLRVARLLLAREPRGHHHGPGGPEARGGRARPRRRSGGLLLRGGA